MFRYFDLSELFPVQFGQQVNQVHSHSKLIMGDRVERLLEVHKAQLMSSELHVRSSPNFVSH